MAVFATASALLSASSWAAPKDEVQMFILAGQSNTEGLGVNTELKAPLDKPQSGIQIWMDNEKGLQPLAPGFGHVPSWFGSELTLGRTLKPALGGSEIVIVKAGYSGANLAVDWNPKTGQWYGVLKEKIEKATVALTADGKKVHLAGMFWIQGESDTMNKDHAEAYADNLTAFIATVREDLKSPELPFIFTRVHAKLGDPTSAVHGQGGFNFVPIVRKGQETVATKVARTKLVDTDKLSLRLSPPNYDNLVHYDSEGFLDLGKALAKAYLELAKK
jgi:hypothetical protein